MRAGAPLSRPAYWNQQTGFHCGQLSVGVGVGDGESPCDFVGDGCGFRDFDGLWLVGCGCEERCPDGWRVFEPCDRPVCCGEFDDRDVLGSSDGEFGSGVAEWWWRA